VTKLRAEKIGIRFSAGSRKGFSSRHQVQTGSGDHPVTYPMGTGVRRPGSEADHSPPI